MGDDDSFFDAFLTKPCRVNLSHLRNRETGRAVRVTRVSLARNEYLIQDEGLPVLPNGLRPADIDIEDVKVRAKQTPLSGFRFPTRFFLPLD